jgi:lipopolysaccharide transport system permease protein
MEDPSALGDPTVARLDAPIRKDLPLYRELWKYRSLMTSLVRRQYQLRYRQSLAGFGWAVLPPIASLMVATLVFHRVLDVNAPRGTPYALFTLAGLAPWTFFANAVSNGVPSVVGTIQLVTRLWFPRAVLPLSMIGTALIDLALTAGVFIVYAYATGFHLPPTALLFPVLLLIEFVLATGVTLLGAALNAFARDIRLAVPIVMQLWLFITPVMYPLASVPQSLRPFFLANPMTGIIQNFRLILIDGRGLSLHLLTPSIIGSVALLVLGTWYFSVTENRFADVV